MLSQIRELGVGWAFKNKGGEGGGGQARTVRLEFAKMSTWGELGVARPAKTRTVGVGMAKPAKAKAMRLGFAK